MNSIIIASANLNKISHWQRALELKYPVIEIDNFESIINESNNQKASILLVLDSLLITETTQLTQLEHYIGKVLVVGENIPADQQIQFIYSGAWGYCEYSTAKQLILKAIDSILKNEIWLERQLIPQMLKGIVNKQNSSREELMNSNLALKTLSILTHREIEVIELVYSGKDIHFIAQTLNITQRTVKAHLTAIFRKFKVEDRFQLIVFLKDLHIGHSFERNSMFEGIFTD